MGAPTYRVRPLDESTWPTFAALVEHNNGIFGGCWCMGFHPEGVGKDTTAELNRDRKLARVRAGTAHAALVFQGDDCLGWCQFGTPRELPRIKSRAAYEKGQTAPPDWRIACCYVGKGHRRQGVAAAALIGAQGAPGAGGDPVMAGDRQHIGDVLLLGQQAQHERPGPFPRLCPAETPADPGHQLIEYPQPAARVYAVASGHQKIITSRHKPRIRWWPPRLQDRHTHDHV
jgi:hypothetical protein